MIKNYFKLAIKVLGRRKFFTFISLFGISFTLMILMVITAFLDHELGKHAPMSDRDKMVFLDRLVTTLEVIDTVPMVDSSLIDGVMRYDTTYDYVDRRPSYSSSSLSYTFLNNHLKNIDGAEQESFYQPGGSFDVFINSNKLSLSAIYTDAPYWSIYDFRLKEGRFYQPQEVENQEQVVVIPEKTAKSYFGKQEGVIGELIRLDDKQYEVIGLIETPNSHFPMVSSDIYLPLTNMNPRNLTSEDFHGGFEAVFLSQNTKNTARIKDDIRARGSRVKMPRPEEYNRLQIEPATFTETYSQSVIFEEDPAKSKRIVFSILGGLLLLFILLPTLNLINVNISRIMECSAEIGVRKAFGAHSSTILFQFVFENVILTFLGGIIGLLLAVVLLNIINSSNALGEITLGFNIRVFIYSFLICLVFGVLSGIIPAYRMSKLHISNALKQNQL